MTGALCQPEGCVEDGERWWKTCEVEMAKNGEEEEEEQQKEDKKSHRLDKVRSKIFVERQKLDLLFQLQKFSLVAGEILQTRHLAWCGMVRHGEAW